MLVILRVNWLILHSQRKDVAEPGDAARDSIWGFEMKKNTNSGPDNMFNMVRQNVFEFIKHIGTGEESAYSRYMKNAIFLIPNARTLTKIVEGVNALDMKSRDAMGDVYEYILGKVAASGTNGQFSYSPLYHPHDWGDDAA